MKLLLIPFKYVEQDFFRSWNYEELKTFINRSKNIKPQKKQLLLQVIHTLKEPFAEAKKKAAEIAMTL